MQSLVRTLLKPTTNGSISSLPCIPATVAPLSSAVSSNGGLIMGNALNSSDAKVKWNGSEFSSAGGTAGSGSSNGGGVGIGETPVEEFSTRFGPNPKPQTPNPKPQTPDMSKDK